MTRPAVLMPAPMNDLVVRACEERFDLLRLWEYDDPAAVLAERGGEVRAIASGGHGIVDAQLMDLLPRLELVAHAGVGYDTVDAAEATRRGVVITNAAGALDDEVADTTMGLLLMAVRELSKAERYLRAGLWPTGEYPLTPATMTGRRVGILGLGRIGEAVARRATSFGMSVVYHNRRRKDVPYPYYPSLLDMARDVDTLVVVLPGGGATRHLVDKEVLEALGPDGVLVNVGRGSVVDEAALVEALEARTIHAAGLDVFEDEPHPHPGLLESEHAVLLPHIGSASVPTRAAMARLCADNLVSWFESGVPVTPVPESEPLVAALAAPRG